MVCQNIMLPNSTKIRDKVPKSVKAKSIIACHWETYRLSGTPGTPIRNNLLEH